MIEILVKLLNDLIENEKMRHMICYILQAIEIQYVKHYKRSILIRYQSHVFKMLESKEFDKYKSSCIGKISDALNILKQMIKSTNTTKTCLLLDTDLVYFIIYHTKKIYTSQLVNDKIPILYLEILHKFISFINNNWDFFTYLSKNEIINYIITIKMIKISNQNERIKRNFMQFIFNIVNGDKQNIQYLIQILINDKNKILYAILKYTENQNETIDLKILETLNKVIQFDDTHFILQSCILQIVSIIQKIEFKHIDITIITTTIQHIINFQNYDLILSPEIIAFMMHCLESKKETELINMICIINKIFESNHEISIKYLLNFDQGELFCKISAITNNYKSITDKNKPFLLKIFINIKKCIIMQFIDINDLKMKLNKCNFVNSLINCGIISISKKKNVIFNNSFIDNRSMSFKTDIMYLVSICDDLNYKHHCPVFQGIIIKSNNKNLYTRLKSIILRIISSYSAIEGCSKQYIINEESLSFESSADIIAVLNIMIEKYEIFTTIDEEHYQIVQEEEFSDIDDDDDGLSI